MNVDQLIEWANEVHRRAVALEDAKHEVAKAERLLTAAIGHMNDVLTGDTA